MIRTLTIIRHAKSSWDNPHLDDFHRPLNHRGMKDAPEMGKRLKDSGYFPDLMISSPAVRAIDTCLKIAKAVGYPKDGVLTDRRLFHASSGEILHVLKETDDLWKNIAVFGHNPGLTSFANRISRLDIDNIPTCGVVQCELDLESWKNLEFGMGKFRFFDFPKNRHS